VVRINPKRQVPVLVEGDVEICDSPQIFEDLEDRCPDPPLWPRSIAARAQARALELCSDEIFFSQLLPSPSYARFIVTEPPPNVVITFSEKGLTRLFAEPLSFGLGGIGLLLVCIAPVLGARSRMLALAAAAHPFVCIVCIALLM
jgi:hypothetical protein